MPAVVLLSDDNPCLILEAVTTFRCHIDTHEPLSVECTQYLKLQCFDLLVLTIKSLSSDDANWLFRGYAVRQVVDCERKFVPTEFGLMQAFSKILELTEWTVGDGEE